MVLGQIEFQLIVTIETWVSINNYVLDSTTLELYHMLVSFLHEIFRLTLKPKKFKELSKISDS